MTTGATYAIVAVFSYHAGLAAFWFARWANGRLDRVRAYDQGFEDGREQIIAPELEKRG